MCLCRALPDPAALLSKRTPGVTFLSPPLPDSPGHGEVHQPVCGSGQAEPSACALRSTTAKQGCGVEGAIGASIPASRTRRRKRAQPQTQHIPQHLPSLPPSHYPPPVLSKPSLILIFPLISQHFAKIHYLITIQPRIALKVAPFCPPAGKCSSYSLDIRNNLANTHAPERQPGRQSEPLTEGWGKPISGSHNPKPSFVHHQQHHCMNTRPERAELRCLSSLRRHKHPTRRQGMPLFLLPC